MGLRVACYEEEDKENHKKHEDNGCPIHSNPCPLGALVVLSRDLIVSDQATRHWGWISKALPLDESTRAGISLRRADTRIYYQSMNSEGRGRFL